MKSVVLVGMSGVGKSAAAKYIAERLNLPFFDSDEIIENTENKTISEIFAQNNEGYFRTLEAKTILSLPVENCIISIGGGAFENEQSRNFLLQNMVVIYLCADEKTIFNRVKNTNSRPLLQSDTYENITRLIQIREKNYKLAHFTVVTDNKTVEQTADDILKCVNLK